MEATAQTICRVVQSNKVRSPGAKVSWQFRKKINIRTINKPVSALYCVESIRSDQVTQALNKNAERFVYA